MRPVHLSVSLTIPSIKELVADRMDDEKPADFSFKKTFMGKVISLIL
jgi:hypothetical protein